MITFAKINQLDEIYKLFKKYRDIFPHIRKAYIKKKIEKKCCIYDGNICIIYTVYKNRRKFDNAKDLIFANPGDININQIVSKNKGDGNAVIMLSKFISNPYKTYWYIVRATNIASNKFIRKLEFELITTKTWSNGKIEGNIYRKIILPK